MAKTSGNKMKKWRRIAIKGYGRRLKAAMNGFTMNQMPSSGMVSLLKRAGISTPVFDKAMEAMHNVKTQQEIPEGATSEVS